MNLENGSFWHKHGRGIVMYPFSSCPLFYSSCFLLWVFCNREKNWLGILHLNARFFTSIYDHIHYHVCMCVCVWPYLRCVYDQIQGLYSLTIILINYYLIYECFKCQTWIALKKKTHTHIYLERVYSIWLWNKYLCAWLSHNAIKCMFIQKLLPPFATTITASFHPPSRIGLPTSEIKNFLTAVFSLWCFSISWLQNVIPVIG